MPRPRKPAAATPTTTTRRGRKPAAPPPEPDQPDLGDRYVHHPLFPETIEFPVIRGIQSGKEYYTTQIPISILAKLIDVNQIRQNQELDLLQRLQRLVGWNRVKEIGLYVLDFFLKTTKLYVLPPVTIGFNCDSEYKEISKDYGLLILPRDEADIIIIDGQHRILGAIAAYNDPSAVKMKLTQDLGDETIAVAIYFATGEQIRSMFSVINSTAKGINKSVLLSLTQENVGAIIARELLKSEPFRGRVHLEKTSLLSKKDRTSPYWFTMNALTEAVELLLKGIEVDEPEQLAREYWALVNINLQPWILAAKDEDNLVDRSEYLCFHGMGLVGLGIAGNLLIRSVENWPRHLPGLHSIEWSRYNDDFEAIGAIENGMVVKRKVTTQALGEYLAEKLLAYEPEPDAPLALPPAD